MKKLVILTGSGISAESGLKTFRDMGGLWELYDVTQVASPVAWETNPDLVLRFYNERRKQLLGAKPNAGHKALAALEEWFDVTIITQNVDDLHERAGSTNILHLHGELRKARSTADPSLIYDIDGWELKKGDLCEKGSQLRPHVVWFGEPVTRIPEAAELARDADIFLIVGTSLVVYPAAGLVDFVPSNTPIFLVDPNDLDNPLYRDITFIREAASTGVEKVKQILLKDYAV
ncbi:MAG TPA: NAD-dependent deacylase [Bacteroidales bacterium]|nr:NAD-dependent deacylase [Bacteroidales bacterium]